MQILFILCLFYNLGSCINIVLYFRWVNDIMYFAIVPYLAPLAAKSTLKRDCFLKSQVSQKCGKSPTCTSPSAVREPRKSSQNSANSHHVQVFVLPSPSFSVNLDQLHMSKPAVDLFCTVPSLHFSRSAHRWHSLPHLSSDSRH